MNERERKKKSKHRPKRLNHRCGMQLRYITFISLSWFFFFRHNSSTGHRKREGRSAAACIRSFLYRGPTHWALRGRWWWRQKKIWKKQKKGVGNGHPRNALLQDAGKQCTGCNPFFKYVIDCASVATPRGESVNELVINACVNSYNFWPNWTGKIRAGAACRVSGAVPAMLFIGITISSLSPCAW